MPGVGAVRNEFMTDISGLISPPLYLANKLARWSAQGFGWGVKRRVSEMLDAVETYYCELTEGGKNNKKDPLDIVGFSRGSAEGRDFLNKVQAILGRYRQTLRFVGLYDTVVTMGGQPGEWGGLNLNVPGSAIGKTYHAIAAHESRNKFPVERITGATEVWFPGAHADVGGGYSETDRSISLALISGHWMMSNALSRNVPLSYAGLYEGQASPLVQGHNELLNGSTTSLLLYWQQFRDPHGATPHLSLVLHSYYWQVAKRNHREPEFPSIATAVAWWRDSIARNVGYNESVAYEDGYALVYDKFRKMFNRG